MFPSLCFAGWNSADTKREILYGLLHTTDWLQTQEIARNPDYYETNLVLGSNPSVGEVNTYFAMTLIGHVTISYFLPEKHRKIWQFITIGIEAGVVGHNVLIGVRF